MTGNSDRRVIGKCSQCGGVVSIPTFIMSVNRPVPSCESCGAVMDITANLPVIPTRPVKRSRKLICNGRNQRLVGRLHLEQMRAFAKSMIFADLYGDS